MKTKIIKMGTIDYTLAIIIGGTLQQRVRWVKRNWSKMPDDWIRATVDLSKTELNKEEDAACFQGNSSVGPAIITISQKWNKPHIFEHEKIHLLAHLHDKYHLPITGEGQEWAAMLAEYLTKEFNSKNGWVNHK